MLRLITYVILDKQIMHIYEMQNGACIRKATPFNSPIVVKGR